MLFGQRSLVQHLIRILGDIRQLCYSIFLLLNHISSYSFESGITNRGVKEWLQSAIEAPHFCQTENWASCPILPWSSWWVSNSQCISFMMQQLWFNRKKGDGRSHLRSLEKKRHILDMTMKCASINTHWLIYYRGNALLYNNSPLIHKRARFLNKLRRSNLII